MNFVSKFDGSLSISGTHPKAQLHVDTATTKAPSDAIVVQDAQLLFTGDFKRSGSDLVISKGDHELRLADYFKGDKHAPLASPDGAYLTGKIVDALTGHVEVAQAGGSASAVKIIGHVTKLSGSASVIRNGVSIILNNGDNVHQGDVVQTGSNSSLGITFIDGSVFGLASNAKMVLNEMVYDPNGSNNSSLVSLVQGTISFVAGATAKHGDMKVDTPVATMGIRGTAVLVEIEFDVTQPGNAPPARFQVLVEPDGTTGSYVLLDRLTLLPMATINQAGTVTTVSGQGVVSFLASAQLSPEAMKLISEVFSQKYTDNTNPKSDTHFTDTPVPVNTFPVKFADGSTGTATITVAKGNESSGSQGSGPTGPNGHIPGKPSVFAGSGEVSERELLTGSSLIDKTSDIIRYADTNAGDVPTARTAFDHFTYKDAHGNDVTSTLTATQKAAIANVSVPLIVAQDPASKNFGTATWTYQIPDGSADFLAEGEKLTLTYTAYVDTNYTPANETGSQTFTITLTGTNDTPTIVVEQTNATGGVIEDNNVVPPGGGGGGNAAASLSGNLATGGTITFKDVDLTDTHTASFVLKSSDATANLPGFAEGTGTGAAQIGTFALTAVSETPADANDNGSLGWTFTIDNNNPVVQSLAQGQTITQVYTITVSDGHTDGGTVTKDVTVTITGTNDAPTIVGASTIDSGGVKEDTNVVPPPDDEDGGTAAASLDAGTINTGGTIGFQDVDLIDLHTASFVNKSSASDLPGFTNNSTYIGTFSLDPVSENNGDTINTASVGWHFKLNDNDPTLQALAEGETITQVYTVTVYDGHVGGTVTRDVTVTITGTNDVPTIDAATTIDSGEVIEDTDLNLDNEITTSGTVGFQDVDRIDLHTASFANKSSTSNATLPGFQNNVTYIGEFSLDPVSENNGDTDPAGSVGWHFKLDDNDPTLQSLAAGETITQVYTVTVYDGHTGGYVTRDVTVTITGTNDGPDSAPVIVEEMTTATGEVKEDIDVNASCDITTDGIIAFRDVDLIDPHTADFVNKSSASNLPGFANNTTYIGEFSLDAVDEDTEDTNNIGSVAWHFKLDDHDPTLQSLAEGETITQVYTVTVDDGHTGGTVSKDVTVTITGTNDKPTIDVALTTASGGVKEDTDVNASCDITTAGTLAFKDVDLIDQHTADFVAKSSTSDLPGFVNDSTYIGEFSLDPVSEHNDDTNPAGSVGWHFVLDDKDPTLQALAEGETITQVYTVTVDDGHTGGTVTKDVTVTITGTNDKPTIDVAATTDSGEVKEDTDVNASCDITTGGTIAFKDVDRIDLHTAEVAEKSSTSNLPGFVNNSTYIGTFSLDSVSEQNDDTNPDGSVGWHFVLDDKDPTLQALAEGETITQVYTVTIDDGHTGGTVTKDVTVTITGTNDKPTIDVAATTASGTVIEDTDVNASCDITTGGTIAFKDADRIDLHTADYVVKSSTSDLPGFVNDSTYIGTFTLDPASEHNDDTNPAGSVGWHFTLDSKDPTLQSLADGETITQVYTVTIHDGHTGGTVTQDVTVTITGTNDGPKVQTAATVLSGSVTEDTDVDVPTNDISTAGNVAFKDVDLTDMHAATVVFKSSSAGPDLPGFTEGTAAGGADHIGTFAIAVDESNIDTVNTGSVGWTFTVDNDDYVLQSLAEDQSITQVYTVTVPDGHGGSVSRDVTVTINGKNDDPHAANVALTSAPPGDGWVFDPDNGHYYRYVEESVNFAGATSAAGGDGAYLATITSAAENTFIANLPGMSSVEYGVWTGGETSDANPDGSANDPSHWSWSGGPETGVSFSYTNWNPGEPNGGFDTTHAAMQIGADGTWNDVPTSQMANSSYFQAGYVEEWGGRPSDPVTEDAARDFSTSTLLAQATDADTTDVLTVTSVSATSAEGATVSLSGGTITYDPTHAAALQALAVGETATDTFSYTVSDGHGGTSTATATVNVVGLNDAPAFVAAGDQSLVNHLTGISVPENSQDGQSHPYDDQVWSVTGAAGDLNDSSGIGYLINPSLGNDFYTPQYSLHGHTYIAPYEPDPTKYVITFQFDTPQTVTELDVIEHTNGVTILHGYAGNSLDSMTDVGSSTGSLGDLTGPGQMYNGELNEFQFNNTVSGTYFQVVVEKTSLENGFALFRMTPEGPGSVDSATIDEASDATGCDTPDTASGALLFTDVDASDTHTFTVTCVTASGVASGLPDDNTLKSWLSLGAKTDSTNGAIGSQAWSFSAADKSFDYLAAGEQVTLTYAVQMDDGHGGVATHDVTITVTGSNDAPVIDSNGGDEATPVFVGENTTVVTTVHATDADSTGLTYSIVTGANSPDAAKFSIDSTTGALSFITAPDFEAPGSAEGSNVYTVQVEVADGAGGVDVQTLTVHVTDDAEAPIAPAAATLVGETFLGGSGDQSASDVSFAGGHLYLTYNSLPVLQQPGDHSAVVSFSTASSAPPAQDFSLAFSKGHFNGVASDGSNIYAVGGSHPGAGLTIDNIGGDEDKTLLARFDGQGNAGSNPAPATDHSVTNFFPGYQGVEIFQDVVATTQGGNTVLYAVGHGQPPTANGGYIIAAYDADDNLLHTATEPASGGFSIARDVVEFNGQIWAVGYSEHAGPIGRPTAWAASYDLSSVTMHADTVGSAPGDFSGAAVIGSNLYAVGYVTSNGNDYLVAKYDTNGDVVWSSTFGGSGSDMLTSAVEINGHLYVVGTTSDGFGHTDGVLMEISTTDGSVLSTTTYGGELDDSFNSITTDGHYLYVAGETKSFTSSGDDDAILLTFDPHLGPEIDTDHFQVSAAGNNTPTTVTDLAVSDPNPGETLTFSAVTAEHATYGSSITPSGGSGDLATVNAGIASVTYDPGDTPPPTDMITFTVSGASGSDTVHFVFDQADDGPGIHLTGTSGKDVIFATEGSDTLTGLGGRDQFVFTPASTGNVQHAVTDFETSIDRIDIRSFDTIDGLSDPDITIAQQGSDTLITLDSHNSILLQNVQATNIHASNFLFHA